MVENIQRIGQNVRIVVLTMAEKWITERYLRDNPTHIFVFGDNDIGVGKGGAAKLRDEPNSYGFITKKRPSFEPSAYYKPKEYKAVFGREMQKLIRDIEACPHLTFLITKLGGDLANKHFIWESVIRDGLKVLEKYDNVEFLFDFEE